jgi:hypothetical protein
MKDWLRFLPEIKQEIQSYLELPQNKKIPANTNYVELTPFLKLTHSREIFSRLQKSALRLESLPNVQEILKETETQTGLTEFTEFLPKPYRRNSG